ncbi:MAG: single-stranded-DNA-specific exonuclease RecJ [Vicinamibacterales bacterium]
MAHQRIWEYPPREAAAVAELAAALEVPPLVAHLLRLRGIVEPEAAHRFLYPSLDHLHDPRLLTGVPVAVERLSAAIAARERIAVHGDYDVDGITSTVILRRALHLLGGDVIHFIPDRLRDGYGLQPEAVDRLAAEGARVIVSVDCGIRSVEAANRAVALGVDLIITDHHEPEDELPRALAVINPKRPDCAYPDKQLAGVGVALKLVQALCAAHGRERWLPSFVKVAAIGTLADVVPLVGENRVITKIGLEGLTRGPNAVGLRSLIDVAGLSGKTLDSFHISFMIAPRVNAAGRMSSPDIATRLLLAADEADLGLAKSLAGQLNDENLKRQAEEADLVSQARKVIEHDPAVGAHNVLVVGGEGWHRGVIGIVASKLVDAYHKPAIVLSVDGDVAHGSCRSIPAFDMLGALTQCAPLFARFGGHRQAAGLTMDSRLVPEFRRQINQIADEVLDPEDLVPRLRIDGDLALSAIDGPLVQALERLAPFGAGNPRPLFSAENVEIVSGPHAIKDRHLKMTLRQGGRVMQAVAWRAAERRDLLEANRRGVRVAYSLERSEYRGETSLELTLADFKPGGA